VHVSNSSCIGHMSSYVYAHVYMFGHRWVTNVVVTLVWLNLWPSNEINGKPWSSCMEDVIGFVTRCHVLSLMASSRWIDILVVTCGIYDFKVIVIQSLIHEFLILNSQNHVTKVAFVMSFASNNWSVTHFNLIMKKKLINGSKIYLNFLLTCRSNLVMQVA
jgi:hypothetical protein